MSKLAIAVITWNNADDSIECIKSLLEQSYESLTILSIDNQSTDDSADRIEAFVKSLPEADIHCIRHDVNHGTAGGFNVALRWARENQYEFVGALNADAIADRDWVHVLATELESHTEAGIVTGLMLRRDGLTVDTSGDFYSIWGMAGPRGRDQEVAAVPREAGWVFGTSGAGYLIRVSAAREVGYFDEKYFMYFEDTDYSFRMQLMGYKIRYTPYAKAYHKVGASASTVPGLAVYNTFKNLPMLMWRNVPFGLLWKIAPLFTLYYFSILINALLHGRAAALKGFFVSIVYMPHVLRSRWHIQRTKVVSNAYIASIILNRLP